MALAHLQPRNQEHLSCLCSLMERKRRARRPPGNDWLGKDRPGKDRLDTNRPMNKRFPVG
jgi:hypothetical protein